MGNNEEKEMHYIKEKEVVKKSLDTKLYETSEFLFKTYPGNHQRQRIIELMTKYLSEPYPVYTYMYFLDLYPDCTILCYDKNKKESKKQGYIAMLAVEEEYRKRGLGKKMVELLIDIYKNIYKVDEISIETEFDNYAALNLYESFGFVRTKMYINYYFNANNAYKLKLFNDKFIDEPIESLD